MPQTKKNSLNLTQPFLIGSLASRYETLQSDRTFHHDLAQQCANLTLPIVYPDDTISSGGGNSYRKIRTPYQGVGARGVSGLAAKLLLVLMPPNMSMFKLQMSDLTQLQAMAEEGGEEAIEEIVKLLPLIEKACQNYIEGTADRAVMYEALIQLLVAGNVLLHCPTDGDSRIYKLPFYVVKRDGHGEVKEIIVRTQLSRDEMPQAIKDTISAQQTPSSTADPNKDETKYDIYTICVRTNDNWETWQEVDGVVVDSSKGIFPLNACEWIPLRMYREDGSDYSRSFVEMCKGDLKSLEGLSQAILEAAVASAKVVFLNRPNGYTKTASLVKAPNGAVITGSADDISVLQVNKSADLRVPYEKSMEIERSLERAFMLTEGARRDAERVTAEEMRMMADELDSTLGGVYSVLSKEFQRPYTTLRMHQLKKKKIIPQLPDDSINISVVTGFEALGRGNERRKLLDFAQGAIDVIGPEVFASKINIETFLSKLAAADSVDTTGLFKDAEVQAQEAEAAQQGAMGQEMISGLIGAGEKMIGGADPELLAGALPEDLPEMIGNSMGGLGAPLPDGGEAMLPMM